MKIKKEVKNKLFQFAIILIVALILVLGLTELFNKAETLSLTNKAKAVEFFDTSYVIATVGTQRKANPNERAGTQEWIKEQWTKAGADWNEVWAVVQCESNWKSNAYNVNNNLSADIGLYMINLESHPEVDILCALNTVCSTKYAIELWKEQKWRPWYGARALGLW